MSTFTANPSIQAPEIRAPTLTDDVSQPQTDTSQRLDEQIRRRRLTTPPAVMEQRQTPRASIQELNATDNDTIRERLQGPPHDRRPPFVKALDLLDLGRNTIANELFGHPTFKGAAEHALRYGAIGAGVGALVAGPVGAGVGAALGAGYSAVSQGLASLAGSVIGSEARDEITKDKELGTGDQPKISVSDFLGHMGVSNHVVRGIMGAVGDFAIDPDIYLGGIGGVTRLVSKTGQAVPLLGGFSKAVRGADEAIKGGRYVAAEHGLIGEALAAAGHTEDTIRAAGGSANGIASKVLQGDIKAGAITGKVLGKDKGAKLASMLSRVGEGAETENSMIPEWLNRTGLTDPADLAKADVAKRIVQKWGIENLSGPKLFGAGSTILHVPFSHLFTENGIGVQIPAFTEYARQALAAGRMARVVSGLGGKVPEAAVADEEYFKRVNDVAQQWTATKTAHDTTLADLQAVTNASAPPSGGVASMEHAGWQRELANHQQSMVDAQKAHAEVLADFDERLSTLKDRVNKPPAHMTDQDILQTAEMARKYQDLYDELAKPATAATDQVKKRRGILNDVSAHAQAVIEPIDKLADFQAVSSKGGPGKEVDFSLGREPPAGVDLPADLEDMKPIGRRDYQRRTRIINERLDAMKGLDPDAWGGQIQDLERQKTILAARDRFFNVEGRSVPGAGEESFSQHRFLDTDHEGNLLAPKDPDRLRSGMEAAKPIMEQLDETEKEIRKVRPPSGAASDRVAGNTLLDTALAPDEAATSEASRVAEYDRLAQKRVALRNELQRVTAPLRGDGLHPLDEAEQAVRDAHLKGLKPEDAELAGLTDEEAKWRSVNADTMHAHADAAFRVAESAKNSIASYADPREVETAAFIARALGTDSTIMGWAPMVGIRTVLERMGKKDGMAYRWAERLDKASDHILGRRNGAVQEVVRHGQNTATRESVQLGYYTLDRLRNQLTGILTPFGLNHKMDEAIAMVHALAYDQVNAAQKAGGLSEAIHTTVLMPDGKKVADRWVQLLADAQKSGAFTEAASPGLMDKLREYATGEPGLGTLRQMGESEVEDQILHSLIPGGVPLIPTTEARSAIAQAARQSASKEGARTLPLNARRTQAFQRQRQASKEYRFISQRPGFEGKERSFVEGDLAFWKDGLSAPELKTIRESPEYKDVADMVDDIAEYQAMPVRPAPAYLSAFAMNDLYNAGRFNHLTDGARLPGGMFDTNWLTMMASRVASHERAVASQTLAQNLSRFHLLLDKNITGTARSGDTIRLRDGSEATARTVKIGGTEQHGVDYGGQFYRYLSDEARGTGNNMLLKGMGLDTKDKVLLHSDVADLVENAAKLFSKDEHIHAMLTFYDAFAKDWKLMTLARPSWVVSNVIGDPLNAWAGGARVADFAKHSKNAIRMVWYRNSPEVLRSIKFEVRGQTMTGEDLWNTVRARRLAEQTLRSDIPSAAIKNGLMGLPSQAYARNLAFAAKNPKLAATLMGKDYRFVLDQYAASLKQATPGFASKAATVHYLFDDRMMQWFYGPIFRLAEQASNTIRSLTFLSHLEQGHDVPSAARKTIESQFDYTWETAVEKKYLKRAFPFESWMRNNGAYQVHQLLQHPIYAGSFPIVQNAIEEMIDGESRVPEYQRPSWMRDQVAIQLGSSPEGRVAFTPGTLIPQADAVQAILPLVGMDGAQEFAHYFLNQINPLPKKAAEFALGRDFYSGKEISTDSLLSPTPPGRFASELFPIIDTFRRPAEVAMESGAGAGLGRVALGGRLQPFGEERTHAALAHEFRDETEKLQATVRRAEFQGDHATSLAARTRLMQAYQSAIKAGVPEAAPAWARRELAGAAPAG